jgi:hypothetical protein
VVETSFAGLERPHQDATTAVVIPVLIADLPELTVAFDVDAKVILAPDHLLNASPGQLVETALIAAAARVHDLGVVVRVRKSARMRGENAVRTALHKR